MSGKNQKKKNFFEEPRKLVNFLPPQKDKSWEITIKISVFLTVELPKVGRFSRTKKNLTVIFYLTTTVLGSVSFSANASFLDFSNSCSKRDRRFKYPEKPSSKPWAMGMFNFKNDTASNVMLCIWETYSRIGLLRSYGNLQSYWTTTKLWKLTVVLDY